MLLALVIRERIENKIIKAGRGQIVEGLECQAIPNHSRMVVVRFWGAGSVDLCLK